MNTVSCRPEEKPNDVRSWLSQKERKGSANVWLASITALHCSSHGKNSAVESVDVVVCRTKMSHSLDVAWLSKRSALKRGAHVRQFSTRAEPHTGDPPQGFIVLAL